MKHSGLKPEIYICIGCFILAFIFAVIFSKKEDAELSKELSGSVLRFRILANSDSREDQDLKLMVRDYLLLELKSALGENADKETTQQYISENRTDLEIKTARFIYNHHFPYGVRLELTDTRFPKKIYGKAVFPAGSYKALKVTLGEGKGHNWWCLLYPSLCFTDAVTATVSDASMERLKNTLDESVYEAITNSSMQVEYHSWLIDHLFAGH